MLFRIATARGYPLGKVEVRSVTGDSLYGINYSSGRGSEVVVCSAPIELVKCSAVNKNLGGGLENNSAGNAFLRLDLGDGSHPSLKVVSPYPRMFIYSFSEGNSLAPPFCSS